MSCGAVGSGKHRYENPQKKPVKERTTTNPGAWMEMLWDTESIELFACPATPTRSTKGFLVSWECGDLQAINQISRPERSRT